jgi:hypothetical protein
MLRQQSTWFASPPATASIALTIAPAWPGTSTPPDTHAGCRPSWSWISRAEAPLKPGPGIDEPG